MCAEGKTSTGMNVTTKKKAINSGWRENLFCFCFSQQFYVTLSELIGIFMGISRKCIIEINCDMLLMLLKFFDAIVANFTQIGIRQIGMDEADNSRLI